MSEDQESPSTKGGRMSDVIKPQSRAITPTGIGSGVFETIKLYFSNSSSQMPLTCGSDDSGPIDVNQQRSNVGRDQIGVQNVNNYYDRSAPSAVGIESLLQTLQDEMSNNKIIQETISKLQRFHKTSAYKGVAGLEAKLNVSGRDYEYDYAIETKELFAKLLEEFSLYASAQEIIAYLLARAEYNFRSFIYPQIDHLSKLEINTIVDERIVGPTVQECGSSVFKIDHSVAMGMIYWLAEQCHVRWHQ
jgi:hypothetical protein